MNKEEIKKGQVKFANWLNKEGMTPSIFNSNKWVSYKRCHKHSKEPIVYSTEQLLDEFYLVVKCGLIAL